MAGLQRGCVDTERRFRTSGAMSERQHHSRQQQPHRRSSSSQPSEAPDGGRKLKRPKKEPAAAASPARAAPTSSSRSAPPSRRPSEPVRAAAAATAARRNSKSKAQPPPKPQPKQQRKPEPPARHNGERVGRKRRAGVGRSQGILGLCDSFSSQCDLRGSRSASAAVQPGTGGARAAVEPVPSPGPNLRPKFPAFLASMAAVEDWPTARVQRVASLNAMAKVHILYENESRPAIVEADDAQEDCKALVPLRADHLPSPSPPPPAQSSPPESPPTPTMGTRRKKKAIVARKVIKRKRDVLDPDVEIIDTRQCRRMASLNAQAIMAASYSRDR